MRRTNSCPGRGCRSVWGRRWRGQWGRGRPAGGSARRAPIGRLRVLGGLRLGQELQGCWVLVGQPPKEGWNPHGRCTLPRSWLECANLLHLATRCNGGHEPRPRGRNRAPARAGVCATGATAGATRCAARGGPPSDSLPARRTGRRTCCASRAHSTTGFSRCRKSACGLERQRCGTQCGGHPAPASRSAYRAHTVATACLLVAMKECETIRRLRDVINVMQALEAPGEDPLIDKVRPAAAPPAWPPPAARDRAKSRRTPLVAAVLGREGHDGRHGAGGARGCGAGALLPLLTAAKVLRSLAFDTRPTRVPNYVLNYARLLRCGARGRLARPPRLLTPTSPRRRLPDETVRLAVAVMGDSLADAELWLAVRGGGGRGGYPSRLTPAPLTSCRRRSRTSAWPAWPRPA